MSGNKLIIPMDLGRGYTYYITKADLDKIELVSTPIGDVNSYTISYYVDGNYFSKTIFSNGFDETVRTKLKTLPSNTALMFNDIKLKGAVTCNNAKIFLKK